MDNKVYVIAEMACSHDGSIELGQKIIDGAGQAGADAVQLQIWSLSNMMAPNHPVYGVCQKIELSQEHWKQLAQYSTSRYPGMDIFCFIYEHKSVDFAESLNIKGYKLSSADLSNPYMLDRVAETGKKIHLSIGASTEEEIQAAIDRIRRKSKSPIILMYGYQSFPTSIKDIHLNYMMKLKQKFDLPVGYQDHCDAEKKAAFWIPALAVGMGASVIEKHITHNRSAKGVDYESALNPDEYKEFVTMIRDLEDAKGINTAKPFSADELKYRKFQKKSILAAKPLKAGTRITIDDLQFLRAADLGLPPDQSGKILNRMLSKDVETFHLIKEEDVS
jgi:N,N'-diacetyllegionaminate synthase